MKVIGICLEKINSIIGMTLQDPFEKILGEKYSH
jgi:hypothetical protein